MAHTPGPWDVHIDRHGYVTLSAGAAYIHNTSDGFNITGFLSPADAYLLRAAPKLLEALKLLMHEVDESGNGRDPNYGWPKAVSASREAIAEAEGNDHGR